MPTYRPSAAESAQPIQHLNCMKCHLPMHLAWIEPEKPGYDLRTFECAACKFSQTIVVKYD